MKRVETMLTVLAIAAAFALAVARPVRRSPSFPSYDAPWVPR